MSAPVGGRVGERTDVWRTPAYELGARWADLLCGWADLTADPDESAAALLVVVALSEPGKFARETDPQAWHTVRRGLDQRECPR